MNNKPVVLYHDSLTPKLNALKTLYRLDLHIYVCL